MEEDTAASPVSSSVSITSNESIVSLPNLSDETLTSDPGIQRDVLIQIQSRCGVCEQVQTDAVSITCGHSFCRHCINRYWDQARTSEDFDCPQCRKRSRTRPVLKSHKHLEESSSAGSAHRCPESDLLEETEDHQQGSHQPVVDVLQRVKDIHKTSMKDKYESLFEGIKIQENQTLLKRIYTQLYIIEGESEGVNEEHEVLHMEIKPQTQHLQDTPIYCNDIFKVLSEAQYQREKIKSVLTKGIAGIGKTVSVQKFILDWAEGTANWDVDFIFVLPFRELNLIRHNRYSLHKLLLDFHPELQDLNSKMYDACKVVFIFDGLDESRMPLMFSDDSEKVCDVTETSSVSVLMSNLMKGDLLPSALIWITSRPAAANQIPSKYIQRVTEIQGFNDAQKEEYFRKRISDEHQASRTISHIRRVRSLHIMCHIPVFCWISSTVLENILKQDNKRAEIPQTLSEMYIHFLLIQMKMKNQKYDPERDPEKLLRFNREVIVKLAEVAFKQLMKGNVMFYEEDLRECGIDITDNALLYSGICTQTFKEESVIHQRKIYCFIHLSFQEFLAALYVFYYYNSLGTSQFFDVIYTVLKGAVDKSLQSETGHLDLFLRFLLGISLESNQSLLKDLLTHTVDTSESIRETITYIKDKIKDGRDFSTERSINLFLCLLEVNDQTLYREIEEFVRSDKQSEKKLSVAHCSAIAYMLQMSEEVVDEFDLKKYNTTEEGRRRLIPAVNNCTKALLADSKLTHQCCEIIASALQSSNSPLRELDLSNNDLQDSGVKLISDALKSHNCQLHILRESLTGRCYWEVEWNGQGARTSVVYKGIRRKGMSKDCWFDYSENSWSLTITPKRFIACHNSNKTDIPAPSPHSNRVGVSLKMLSRQNSTYPYCQTQNKTESDLLDETKELQRVKDIHKTSMKNKYESLFEGIKIQENQTLLKSIYTQLYIIEGESEGVNEEHEVLHMEKKPRAQHLQDTPIYCNDIFKVLPEAQYQGEKIKSVLTKGIAGIGKTVSVQKFILDWAEGTANRDVDFLFVLPFRELNLIQQDRYSLHKLLLDFHPELQDLNSKMYDTCKVVFIFDGLDESRMKLMFSDDMNDQTLYREIEEFVRSDKQSEKKLSVAHCSAIAYMLQVSEEVMDEFDLKKYNTTEEGRRRLIPAVNNCTRALLTDCNLTVESCEIIASALQSSDSPLRELDLSNNDLRDSGVKLISDALKSHDCQLHILRLSGCMVSDGGCCYLASALSSNPSHLRELDLSYNHPEHSGVQLLSQRLNDTNYKLETLKLDYGGESRLIPGLKKYYCYLTMDSNTAHHHLALSEGNRLVTHVKEKQVYPDHPDSVAAVCACILLSTLKIAF
ncbi:hypothetical protein cypCar_00018698 [Cyprinus carpio]|nr:hypothetical protein cypCar_00018698 [Cyprinus carpio]